MNDDYLRTLLADRLSGRGHGERRLFGSFPSPAHRTRLLTAAAHSLIAARLVLDVLDEVVDDLRAPDGGDAAEDPERDRPAGSDTGVGDVADTAPPPARRHGDIPLTYDLRVGTDGPEGGHQTHHRPRPEGDA